MAAEVGLKAQKLQKQHALKGQKLLAQGIALGLELLPFQGVWDVAYDTPFFSFIFFPL